MPIRVIVFDVNETLLNVRHLEPMFESAFGDRGALKEWFSLLLLHSEAATLAGPYFDFGTLAMAALDMLGASRQVTLSGRHKEEVLQGILSLPPHKEVAGALGKLRGAGFRLVTLTNSSQKTVEQQNRNAGSSEFFERNFSVDAIRRYKPAPEPYRMVASELNLPPDRLRLVAAHAWDVMGAMQAGCAAAFVSRPGRVLFPLTPAPDIVGSDLTAIAQQIIEAEKSSG
jgi:2-haloacid dehalogenase